MMTKAEFRDWAAMAPDADIYRLSRKYLLGGAESGRPDIERLEILSRECLQRGSDAFENAKEDAEYILTGTILGLNAPLRPFRLSYSETEMPGIPENINISELKECMIYGDSMQGAGIFEGMKAIIAPGKKCKSGDIIIAEVDGRLFIKKYIVERNGKYLVSENRKYPPVPIEKCRNFRIFAKVIGIEPGGNQ